VSQAELEARIAALEARVLELEEDRAIRDLLARYGFTADTCQDEAFVELYTTDGRMKVAANAKARRNFGVDEWIEYEGHDGIRAFITHPKGHHSPALYGKSLHLQGNNLVTYVHGDEAAASGYQVAIAVDEDGARLVSAGNNEWQLRKVDGQWRIKERRGAYLGDDKFTTNLVIEDSLRPKKAKKRVAAKKKAPVRKKAAAKKAVAKRAPAKKQA
jgi:SnoaL-like protein